MSRPLQNRRVVTTRESPGRLDSILAAAGADVVHVQLIEVVDAPGGVIDRELDRLGDYDWLAVTSRHGARRVGAAAARHPDLRLAAVGRRTADELEALVGRAVDVVPAQQTATGLAAAMADGRGRVLVAQADRAHDTLVARLAQAGYDVTAVTAYSTRLRTPTTAERMAARSADGVAFASGSAAEAWVRAVGATDAAVVAIGPTTALAAERAGLKVAAVAADQHIEGLAAAVIRALGR